MFLADPEALRGRPYVEWRCGVELTTFPPTKIGCKIL